MGDCVQGARLGRCTRPWQVWGSRGHCCEARCPTHVCHMWLAEGPFKGRAASLEPMYLNLASRMNHPWTL